MTLTLNASDATTSVSQMMVSNTANFTGASSENYATSKDWVLTSGSGTRTVYVKYKDEAGNVSEVYSDGITIDIPPIAVALSKIGNLATIDGIYTYYYTNGKNLTFTGTTSPNAYVTLTVESDPITCTNASG